MEAVEEIEPESIPFWSEHTPKAPKIHRQHR